VGLLNKVRLSKGVGYAERKGARRGEGKKKEGRMRRGEEKEGGRKGGRGKEGRKEEGRKEERGKERGYQNLLNIKCNYSLCIKYLLSNSYMGWALY
jgi:hypothetical protein